MKMYQDQYIVVTGGAGFIGSAVVRYLNDRGFGNLIIVDELGHSEKWKNLVGKKFMDVLEVKDFFSWLKGKESAIEAFIHLGACSDTMETDASYLLENNYRFSVRLAEYAFKNNQRFIYASSAATYGDGELGFIDSEDDLDTLHPLNMYGYSKQLFDLWLKDRGYLNRVVGLKFFNVFGPNEGHKGRMASAIVSFVSQIQNEGKVKLFRSMHPDYTDGEQKRDFVYIKDAVRMICSFLENDRTGIYNIGSGVANSWNNLAHAVFLAMGVKPQIEYIDMPEQLQGKYQYYTCADMNKTQAALGEESEVLPLDESVADYVQNYLLPSKLW